ncbi:NAD-dependent epimerase/dehydratase family protein [Mariniblastus sp.]|nr:NAD-dependent epimerase/dehydratase family protein [Mariniblastus sp.]
MKIKKAFVTGGTGFIGTRLVKQLIDNGTEVVCLVRKQSKTETLVQLGCQLIYGDLQDRTLSLSGVQHCDVLFHVAATKNAANPKDLLQTNPTATENLLEAVLRSSATPRIIGVSSLAACGPSVNGRPTIETDSPSPVSYYGRSKLLCEQTLIAYADRLPISIVRPPIVIGQGDANALRMFKLIQKFNCHLIPGSTDRQYSIIHVDDLVEAMIGVACQGQTIADAPAAAGIYFVSAEQLIYAELGQKIGLALDRSRIRNLYVPRPIFWSIGATNSLLAWATNRPRFLNLDKYREASAGEWTCSAAKLFEETDVKAPVPLQTRLEQTVQWYQQHGWLSSNAPNAFHTEPTA